MQAIRRAVGILGLAASLSAPLAAQESREIMLFANAGGMRSLTSLDRNNVYDSGTGLGIGGGLGLQLIDRLVVRADFNYSKTPVTFQGIELDSDFDRLALSLIAQIQFPSAGGLNPYVLAGAGALFLDQHTTVDPKKTLGHFLTGVGLGYRLGGSGLSLFTDGRLYMYQPRGLVGGDRDETRFQADVLFSAGLSYALPIGSR
jgi:opacity protein-like surface antigen